MPRLRHAFSILTLTLAGTMLVGPALAQAPPGPPPSVANEPPPEPGAEELHAAARKGDVAAVKALLDKGINANAKWRYGTTALFPACDRGHIEVVKLLIERGAEVNVRESFYGFTPFQSALGKGHMEVVKLLFEKGAGDGPSVLGTAVARGNAELAKLALARGGIKPESLTGALLRAKRANHAEIVSLLQTAGAQPPSWSMDEPSLAAFVGSYGDGGAIRILVKDGGLMGTAGGQVFHFFPLDGSTFRAEEMDALTVAFQQTEGAVTAMVIKQAGRPDQTLKKNAEVKQ